ncbi:MAG TPA: YdeI/OmpD-associated family protein [Candidatus Acidoferrales bacterium]|nr:YdeI/OmpD-associated family protein [Candidatus Acidoferrales bacterium]
MPTPVSKTFRATLERIDSPLKWVMVRVPFDAGKVWGKRGQVKVKGEINGFAFRTSLFPDGKGGHRLLVNKQMQRGAKTAPGMAARFRLEPDQAPRGITVPAELRRALSGERALLRWFNALSYSMRNDICRSVAQTKNPAVRQRRAEVMAECLMATMEAERDTPPALQMALAENSLAHEGWQAMSVARRRGHFYGIFHCRSQEARERRIAKAVEDAALFAEKKNRKR